MSTPAFFAFFGFDSIGFPELVVMCAVLLIVVGPRNLPSTVRKIGEIMGKLRRTAEEFKRQLLQMENEMNAAERRAAEAIELPSGEEEVPKQPEPPPPMGGELPPGAMDGTGSAA